MAEVSVESELINNPSAEQISYLENARDNSNYGETHDSGSDSITTESSVPITETKQESVLDEKSTSPQEERTISYTGQDGQEFHYSVREWEDDWNKRGVDNQWQNLGRAPEDMYDRESFLDRNGKSAWEEMSSLGVPKAVWLEELYKTDDKGNFLHQEQIDSVREARQRSRADEKELKDYEYKTFRDNSLEADNLKKSNEIYLPPLKIDHEPSRDIREEYIRNIGGPNWSGERGMLEETAKNAPMYAQAGIPDYNKVTTDLNTTAAEHQLSKEKQTESDIKASEADKVTREKAEAEKDLAELNKMIDDVLSYKTGDSAKVGQKITEAANALTLGIAPKTNDITGLDKDAFRNAVYSYKNESGKTNKEAVTYISQLADKSSMGLAKEGIEYYIRTGDTLGNKHAIDFENRITELTDYFVNGKISEDEYSKQIDKLSNVSNTQQLLSLLSSPAVSGVAGLAAGAAVGAGVAKIAEKPLAFAAQKLAEMAGKVGPNGLEHPFAAKIMDKIFQENRGKIASELFDKYKDAHQWRTAEFLKAKPGTVGSIWETHTALENSMIEPATVVAAAAAEAAKEKAGKAAAISAPAAVSVATSQKAEAAPTGIYDEAGKMIDSRDIVAERKDKPYEGEDAVTLKSREGEVIVSPREAVIIGESEHLTPERGYTEEVKEKAKGSEVYEKPEVEKIETLPDKQITTFQRGVDILQAILGGRDINLDRTITAREWYDSTLGKVVDKIADFFSFSGKDNIDKVGEKSLWDKAKEALVRVGNKVSDIADSIGSSLKGVVDLSTGNVYVIEEATNKPNNTEAVTKEKTTEAATKEGNLLQRGLNSAKEWVGSIIPDKDELVGSVKNALSNAMPSWSDEAKRDLATEAVLHVGDLASFGPIQFAKGAGKYITETTDEIYWLTTGNRLSNDDKAALNFVITNMIGLLLAPASTIARDINTGIGSSNRSAIEAVLSGESNTYIMPYIDEKASTTKTEDEEKKKRSIDELEEVTSEGNKQDSLSGINLPGISDDDLAWLVRRPEMKNYNYGGKQ